MADKPAIRFSRVAGAAFVRRRGTLITAAHWMSSNRSLAGTHFAQSETELAPQPDPTIQMRDKAIFRYDCADGCFQSLKPLCKKLQAKDSGLLSGSNNPAVDFRQADDDDGLRRSDLDSTSKERTLGEEHLPI
jgi:hypothetical protein